MTSRAHRRFATIFDRGILVFEMSVRLWRKTHEVEDDNYMPKVAEYNVDAFVSDMGRAGIVIAVSAFDDYFTRRFCEAVVPVLKKHKPNKHLAEMLSSAGLDVVGSLELLSMQRPYRRIRTLIDRHLESHVTQRFDKIDDLFNVIGLGKFSAGVQKRAKRSALCKSVSILVERRHSIVHSGDLNKKGVVVSLSPRDTRTRLNNMRLFVDTADSIIQDRLR